jgi:4-hydroxybenzoate polyprenyltransferase
MFKSLINFFYFIKFHHSVKNLLILLPLFAAHNFKIIFNFDWILHFFYWCIFSHFAYYVNNLYDYSTDVKNTLKNIKYYKPNKKIIIFWSIFILTILQLKFNYLLKTILILYLMLNIFYTLFLKNFKFFDIFILSIFFILRILYGAIYFNIKCNSTQSRLQCSFNRFQEFIEKNPEKIVAKSNTNEFRGGSISPSIISSRRNFKNKPIVNMVNVST